MNWFYEKKKIEIEDLAKRKVEDVRLEMDLSTSNVFDGVMCELLIRLCNDDFEYILKRYGSKEMVEDLWDKSEIIFVALMGDTAIEMSRENYNFKECILEALWKFKGALGTYSSGVAENNMTKEFYLAANKYILRMLLEFENIGNKSY